MICGTCHTRPHSISSWSMVRVLRSRIFDLDGTSRQRNHIVHLRLVHASSRFGGYGPIGQHGIATQRGHVGAGNRIAFRDEPMEFGSFQSDRFANEMHRDASQIFHHLATSHVMEGRDFNGNFTNVQDVVVAVMSSSGQSSGGRRRASPGSRSGRVGLAGWRWWCFGFEGGCQMSDGGTAEA
jgi:hypothetical protein